MKYPETSATTNLEGDVDFIAALNGGANPDRESGLNEDTERRVSAAVGRLAMYYEAGQPSVQLVLAGHESPQMRVYALGLPELPSGANPLVECTSHSTVSNAHYLKTEIVQPNSWRRGEIWTADYHTARTRRLFEHVFGNGYDMQIHGVESPYYPEERAKLARQERQAVQWDQALILRNVGPDQDAKRERRIQRHDIRLGTWPLARAVHYLQNRREIRH